MQKQILRLELEDAKISTKGIQRLIIIPKEFHKELEAKLQDQEYLSEIEIHAPDKTVDLRIVGKISKMAEQRQIFIPMHLHKDLRGLTKSYKIIISVQEI